MRVIDLHNFRLQISCDNTEYGCTAIVKLDVLATHLEECEHNPKKPIPCEQGCGLIIPKDELKDHNCVRELRALVQTQQHKIGEVTQDLSEHKFQMDQIKMELQLLKVIKFTLKRYFYFSMLRNEYLKYFLKEIQIS